MEKEEEERDDDLFHALNDWEQIQLPSPSPLQPHHHHHQAQPLDGDGHGDDCDDLSIFPPSNHEGLHIPTQHQPPSHHHILEEEEEDGPSMRRSSPLDADDVDPPGSHPPLDSPLRVVGDIVKKRLNLGFEIVCSKVLCVVSLVRSSYARRRVKSSFASAVGIAAAFLVSLWYLRWQRKRHRRLQQQQQRPEKVDRVIDLIRNQDEKINLLLDQISQLNELLSVRRHRVPILRSV